MKSYVVGNWKMNFSVGDSSVYLNKLLKKVPIIRDVEVIIAPSTLTLQSLSLQVDRRKFHLAAQNLYFQDFGAFTGETSATQLRGIVDYAIIGHSERRHIFHESDKDIKQKVAAAIRNKITPILCIGETESEHTFGETADVIRNQLLSGLSDLDLEDVSKVIIAYEPVWAISSNSGARVAPLREVTAAITLVCDTLETTYGKKVSEQIPVLYGGSVDPSNAGAYLTITGVNGLLIGGASLILDQFIDIIDIAKRIKL